VIVPKKAGPGEPPQKRMCVDYRALNATLPKVQKVGSNAKGILTLVPLPKIDELNARLAGAFVFSTLDLRMGYHHISLSKEAQQKSAFVTPQGKYEFKRVPFGLAQAPAYFQMMINHTLEGLGAFAFSYLDDILIFSRDVTSHLEHLEQVFCRLASSQLKLKRTKCEFFKEHIQYL
jgi:putative transposase